jgi:uncharacterized membrane protein YjgN (DUF898 family)
MEISLTKETKAPQNYHLEFHGQGSAYFSIMIVNWLLTILTLGIYYPWARAKQLRYIYGQTSLNDTRFHFSGTGKEIFLGYVKIILLFVGGYLLLFLLAYFSHPVVGLLFIYLGFLIIIPFAIHGSLRYRMSRLSYRGIRFGYRGNRSELIKNFFKWIFLTAITFGIYGAWLQMNLRNYTHKHIRYGNLSFENNGRGSTFFKINLVGYFLTILTLGIYYFWWHCQVFNYYIDNLSITRDDDEKINFHSTATGGGFFALMVSNFFIVVFTLGFGTAWADMRTQKYILENIQMEGNVDLEAIHQTEDEYNDAFGEEAIDFFEIDLA